jgi:hypothetical protein
MSLSAIFAKFDEIERQIASINNQPVSGVAPSVNLDDVYNRLGALEAMPKADVDSVNNKLAELESRMLPVELPQKVAELESRMLPVELPQKVAELESRMLPMELPQKVAELESRMLPVELPEKVDTLTNELHALNDKLVHLETITLPHILLRIENIEQKLATD